MMNFHSDHLYNRSNTNKWDPQSFISRRLYSVCAPSAAVLSSYRPPQHHRSQTPNGGEPKRILRTADTHVQSTANTLLTLLEGDNFPIVTREMYCCRKLQVRMGTFDFKGLIIFPMEDVSFKIVKISREIHE